MPPSLNNNGRRAASLSVLTLQNTALAVLLHVSRTTGSNYSAATAVLLNELLKGSISFCVAFNNCPSDDATSAVASATSSLTGSSPSLSRSRKTLDAIDSRTGESPRTLDQEEILRRLSRLKPEILSPDCWKLSVPAILYVIQNNLQFVAASNLDVATFQVSYQLKILTTAVFSVILLKKRLNGEKWAALLFLALGVAIVQLQAASTIGRRTVIDREMRPVRGFLAVTLACITSGLAGVYFEMVLKASNADLWVRNVQLSLFSLIPAFLPAIRPALESGGGLPAMFDGFGGWAWAVVWCQVLGGLVTALVIKYSDNIVKGFATSLSIVISFMASSLLFPEEFEISSSFIVGTVIVLGATYLYNRPSATQDLGSIDQILQIKEPLLPTSSPVRANGAASAPRGALSPINMSKILKDGAEALTVPVQPRPESPHFSQYDEGRKRHGSGAHQVSG